MPYIRVGKLADLFPVFSINQAKGYWNISLANFGPLGPTPYTHYVPLSRVSVYYLESCGGRGMISNHRTGRWHQPGTLACANCGHCPGGDRSGSRTLADSRQHQGSLTESESSYSRGQAFVAQWAVELQTKVIRRFHNRPSRALLRDYKPLCGPSF